MQTSFHHQPEAQHPKSPAIETPAGRLPHLLSESDQIPARQIDAKYHNQTSLRNTPPICAVLSESNKKTRHIGRSFLLIKRRYSAAAIVGI